MTIKVLLCKINCQIIYTLKKTFWQCILIGFIGRPAIIQPHAVWLGWVVGKKVWGADADSDVNLKQFSVVLNFVIFQNECGCKHAEQN